MKNGGRRIWRGKIKNRGKEERERFTTLSYAGFLWEEGEEMNE